MKYIETVLEPEERVVAEAKMHWIIYVRGLSVLLFSFFLISANSAFGALLLLIGILMVISSAIQRYTTEIAATDRRVIVKTGLIRRDTKEIQARRVESVEIKQSILGRILNYGTVTVRGTGQGISPIKNIREPLVFRQAVAKTAR